MCHKNIFCLSKYVYEVMGVQRSLWKPQSLDTAAHLIRKERKQPTPEPRPAGVPVDDAIIATAYHLQNIALLCTLNHINTKGKPTNQPTSNPITTVSINAGFARLI